MKHFNQLYLKFSFALLFFLIASNMEAQIVYITSNGSGNRSGSSWANAVPGIQLQTVINNATSGSQVWVAKGTYKPTTGTDRTISFSMKEGVAIYGGFTGTETALNQRPVITFSQPSASILSGDVGTVNDNGDNSYHVIYNNGNGLSAAAVLDGFVITAGAATGKGLFEDEGGGIYNRDASPSVRNCSINANLNTAVSNTRGSAAFTNCYFLNNSSSWSGGAMGNSGNSSVLTNCIFYNNRASAWGGAMDNSFTNLKIINCTFSHNSAVYTGGAIHNNQSDFPTIINCILWGNSPNQLEDLQGSVSTVKYSDVNEDNWAGQNGNIRQDPFFIDQANGDLRVLDCSLTINKGDNASNFTNKDIDGNPRKYGTIDMGAFEHQTSPTTPTLITTQPSSGNTVNKGGIVSVPVGVSGPVIAYQWYKDGQPVVAQTTATLSLTNVQVAQAGNYILVITGSCNTITSDVFKLIVPTRFYVNAAVAASGDGTSWATAYKTLGEALSSPSAVEVWVAGGTYKPTAGTDRWASFYIPSSVKVYGSFAGTEAGLTERSLSPANRSILSGDVGGKDVFEECSEHVVVFNNVSDQTLLDGFEITDGHSLSSGGGGIYIAGGNSNPVIANCVIKDNYARYGGGVYSDNFVIGITTTNNPSFINCSFSQNRSEYEGGAVYIRYPDLDAYDNNNTFSSCSFSQNSATKGGAIYNSDYMDRIRINLLNCIVWNNTGGGLTNKNDRYNAFKVYSSNIDNQDPLFVDADNGNLRLQACSPAINAGDNSSNFTDKDLDGNTRVAGNAIDMGAYEFQGQTGSAAIINMPQPVTVCTGRQAKFSVAATGANLSFQWQKNEVNIAGATDSVYSIVSANASDTGNYKVTVNSACGSSAVSDNAYLTVHTTPTPVVTVTNNCGSSTLSTSATGSLLWNTGETTSSITVSNAATYSVTNTVDGCASGEGSGTAAPKAIPGKPIITANGATSFCAGGNVTLSAPDGFASYLWSNGALSQSISVNQSASYSVAVTNVNGCTSPLSDAVAVTVNALPAKPVVTAGGATTFCAGGSVRLSAPDGFASYAWSNGAATKSITVNQSGSYSVIVTNGNGCTSPASDAAVITVNALPVKPVVTASGATTFYTGSSVNLSASAGFASYLWNTGSTNATFTVTSGGSYSVTVTNSSGCITISDPVVVTTQVSALTVSYMDGDKKQLANNNIRPYLQVNNEGNTAFAYKELTVRYWLTAEDFAPMTNVFIDWAKLGSDKIKMKYVKLDQPRQGAYGYIEYSFEASAGTLAAKSNSGEIQSRIGKSDWTNFNEQDDYSYASSAAYTKNSKITLYRNGSLIWGTEPSTVAIVQSLKACSLDKSNATTTNTLSPWIKLNNEGNIPVNYKDITIRYWFTADGTQQLNWYLDYNKLGSNVRAKFVNLSPALNNADTYLEISFAAADSLYPISSTGDIEQRIGKSNWSNLNQLNDYSYKAGSAASENMKVTVYVKGTLVYGVEPSNIITTSSAARQVNIASKESDNQFKKKEEIKELSITLLNNPVTGSEVEYIVKGAKDKRLQVILTDVQGRMINVQEFERAGTEERHRISVRNSAAGILFLRAVTQNEIKIVQVMRAK